MKVLVTGAAGFIGSHLCDRLLALGHSVIGVDSLIGGERVNVPTEVTFYEGDCNDYELMLALTANSATVYHCAATPHEGLSVFSPKLITDNIFGATMSVLSAALANRVKRFILCSSMARYGAQTPPFTEDMECRPQDPYGIAKYAADLALANLATTHGMEYVIAVPHNVIGTRQKYDDPFRNVASIFINLMLQDRAPTIYGDGSQVRSFSFIDDVIDPLVLMSTAPVSGEVINIGPDEGELTIKELALVLAYLVGYHGQLNFAPARPQEVKVATCSADKARRLLNYVPKTPLRDGLQTMVDWIRTRGPKPFQYHLPIEIDSPLVPVTWREQRF